MVLTGWNREEAIANIEDCRKRLGISYTDYRRFSMARVDLQDQAYVYQDYLKRDEEDRLERKSNIRDIAERNGWTIKEATETIEKIKARTGCELSEVWSFRLEQMTEEEQDQIYYKCDQKKIKKNYKRPKGLAPLLNDKERSNELFSKYLHRAWTTNERMDYEAFTGLFRDSKGVIYKPVFGFQARGIEAFYFDGNNTREIYDTLKSYPKGVVEELLEQHPKMASLNPTSVNCLRIITVASGTKDVGAIGKHAEITSIIVKTGGDGSVVDNLHAGKGIIFGVDLETGIADSDGVDWYGNVYKTHPVTGVPIRGFEIPMFNETKDFIYEVIDDLQMYGLIGWDIAITPDGPAVIEANPGPAPRLMGLPYAVEKKGFKQRMFKYMYPEMLKDLDQE